MSDDSELQHPAPLSGASYSAVELMPENDVVVMLDQRLLPGVVRYMRLTHAAHVATGIRGMMVRGAPAIGIAAAYGVVLAANESRGDAPAFLDAVERTDAVLRMTRPTAVNLGWALDRMRVLARAVADEPHAARVAKLADAARVIHADDVAACRTMGALGAREIPHGATILTHCNAGALATGGYGTALGVIRAAHEAGKAIRVLADETRPYLQGMRLTAWELHRDGIPVEIIPDGAVGHLLAKRAIDLVIVGADRIARNGDVANKIGTYGVACLAHLHEVPFYVAAPWSTVDRACASGDGIPIEHRSSREVTHLWFRPTMAPPGFAVAFDDSASEISLAPDGVGALHPAFDVTPARYVRAIFTERGAAAPPSERSIDALAP